MTLYLAPLHGVTNKTVRNEWFSHFTGFDRAIAPFIPAAAASRPEAKHFRDIAPDAQSGVTVEPQILAGSRDALLECAARIVELGYDEINLNMGCPYSMVAKKGRGSGLLADPAAVRSILDVLCSAGTFKLSVKIRLGLEDKRDMRALFPVLNDYPLSRVIVHPRVGKQMYRGTVDLDGFAEALELCAHETVYNGDIFDYERFLSLRSRFPSIDSWMIGRGALMDPFLPEQIKTGSRPKDELAKLRAYHEGLYARYRRDLYGPGHLLDKMKEIWSYLGHSFGYSGAPRGGAAPPGILKAKTPEAYLAAVEALFAGTKIDP